MAGNWLDAFFKGNPTLLQVGNFTGTLQVAHLDDADVKLEGPWNCIEVIPTSGSLQKLVLRRTATITDDVSDIKVGEVVEVVNRGSLSVAVWDETSGAIRVVGPMTDSVPGYAAFYFVSRAVGWRLRLTGGSPSSGGTDTGYGGSFDTVATSGVELNAIDGGILADLDEGAVVWVDSVKCPWFWHPTDTSTADNITICAPAALGGGAGRFRRSEVPSSYWASIVAWTVDSDVGVDDSPGTVLASGAELARRLHGQTLIADTTVTATDDVTIPPMTVRTTGGKFFKITYVPADETFSGTATQTQAYDAANHHTAQITSTWTVTDHIGKLAIFANGAAAWVERDLGSAKALMSPPVTALTDTSAHALARPTHVSVDAQGVKVYDLPQVVLDIEVITDDRTKAALVLENLYIVTGGTVRTNGYVSATRCSLGGAELANGRIITRACRRGTANHRAGTYVTDYAGAWMGAQTIEGITTIDDGTLADGTASNLGLGTVQDGGELLIGDAAVYGGTTGCEINRGGLVRETGYLGFQSVTNSFNMRMSTRLVLGGTVDDPDAWPDLVANGETLSWAGDLEDGMGDLSTDIFVLKDSA